VCKRKCENNESQCNDYNNDIGVDEFENENFGTSRYIKNYSIQYCPNSKDASEGMTTHIFPILRKDKIGLKAMADPLLVSLVSAFYCSHQATKD